MLKVERREKQIAWAVAVGLGVVIIVTAFFLIKDNALLNDYIFFAVVIAVFPPAVLDYFEYRWKKSIDEHLPDLFRSIVQAQQVGMTLPQAVEEAGKRDYGPLTQELKKIVNQ